MSFKDNLSDIDKKKLLHYILAGLAAGVGSSGVYGLRHMQKSRLPIKKIFKDKAVTKEFLRGADPLGNATMKGTTYGGLAVFQDMYASRNPKIAGDGDSEEKLASIKQECLELVLNEMGRRKEAGLKLPPEMVARLEGW